MKLKYWILFLILLVPLIIVGVKFLLNSEMNNRIIMNDYEEIEANIGPLDLVIHSKQPNDTRIQQIVDFLPMIQVEQQKIFPKFTFQGKLNVYIIDQEKSNSFPYFKESEEYENVGFYDLNDESIYLTSDLENVSNPFTHEYMHYLMHQYSKSKKVDIDDLPIWFVEGVANSFEAIVTNDSPENIGEFDVTPFHDLQKLTDKNRNAVYGQGMYAVIALMERQGAYVIQNILSSFQENDFNQTFTEVTSVDLTTYHTEFEQDSEMLKTLYDQLDTNPQLVIEKAETLLAQYGKFNIYGTSLLEVLFEAHLSLNHKNESIYYATELMKTIDNPLYLIGHAKRILPISETLSDEMLEVGLSKATSPEEERGLKEYTKDLFAK